MIEKTCARIEEDFEWFLNYKRNARGDCVLVDGAQPLASDATCPYGQPFWYDRTAYRRIPHTKCKDGLALDKGSRHTCPGAGARGGFFWATIAILPFGIAALAAVWWHRRKSSRYGKIRLPTPGEPGRSSAVDILVSIPYFAVGLIGALVEKVRDINIPWLSDKLRGQRRGRGYGDYRSLRLDDDSIGAELLDDYEDEL
ncbi:hypothetical protein JCM10207_000231 [Rhodosporidiobolus poonsookiae]